MQPSTSGVAPTLTKVIDALVRAYAQKGAATGTEFCLSDECIAEMLLSMYNDTITVSWPQYIRIAMSENGTRFRRLRKCTWWMCPHHFNQVSCNDLHCYVQTTTGGLINISLTPLTYAIIVYVFERWGLTFHDCADASRAFLN